MAGPKVVRLHCTTINYFIDFIFMLVWIIIKYRQWLLVIAMVTLLSCLFQYRGMFSDVRTTCLVTSMFVAPLALVPGTCKVPGILLLTCG